MKRLVVISLFIILSIAFITVWNFSYMSGLEEAYIPLDKDENHSIIPSEKGVFERSEFAFDYANMPDADENQRSLKNYYNNRSFYGGPPSIPHFV